MTARTLQILVALAACGGAAFAGAAERVCEQSESIVTPSPRGGHAASVQHQVCDTGAGVSAAITVYVGDAAAPLKGGRVVSVAVPRSRGEWPIARWRDARSLEVWVPNLATVLETQSAYGDVSVTLKYCGDDPEARQRVAQHEVDMQRWMEAVTQGAERRLKVLQSLDTLGAGFQLASHDLDIRGAGNLLGEEQSGHIKEVGFELYQQMLEEAVAEVQGTAEADSGEWSPQIAVGTAVMIPESYVPDLQLRMALYRRIGELDTPGEIDGFGAELIDRFGPLPEEVEHLMKIVFIKALCKRANVEKLDAGPKGVVIHFRNKSFPEPAGLVRYIGEQGAAAKIRPDHSIVLSRDWPTPAKRLQGAAVIMSQLAKIAAPSG